MGFYITVDTDGDETKINLELGKKNSLSVVKSMRDAGFDAKLMFASEPKVIESPAKKK